MTFYIDMDGVLVDFIAGYSKAVKAEPKFKKGDYSLSNAYGKAFVELDCLSVGFWSDLPSTEEYPVILRTCMALGDVKIMSRVVNGAAAVGKQIWLRRNNDYPAILCDKWKGCYPRLPGVNILIDDSEEEIAHWGGPAVLIPRPWNNGEVDGDFPTWFANAVWEATHAGV